MQKISLVSLTWTEERIQPIQMVGATTSRVLITCRLFDLHSGDVRADIRITVGPTTKTRERRNKNSKLWTKPIKVAPNRVAALIAIRAPIRLRRRMDKDEALSFP